MELLLAALPLAGCAAMSLWCHRRMTQENGCAPSPHREVERLRAEVAALRADRASAGQA